ncbi:peptide deformylase [Devosia sp. 2618]|uniref:peptide deformylase n=1 Tax=Devosia sp. 2618 TaxID=3156454 RepID=UPI00339A9828
MPDFAIWPNPALTSAATPRPLDIALLDAGERLLAAATEVNAYGLAAAHLGLVEPVVVVSVATDVQQRDYRVMFNPVIGDVSTETAIGAEGSVSLPGIEVPVGRPVWADVSYETGDGQAHSERLEGFAARVALHEIEQMQGVFFLQRISRIKRDTALRKFEKSRR